MSAPATTPAQAEFIENAAAILGHLGGTMQFRRVAATKDARRGTEVWAAVDLITARAHRFTKQRRKESGVSYRVERIDIERMPFEPEGLTDAVEVFLEGGGWTALGNINLSPDATSWEADLLPMQVAEPA